MLPLAEAKPVHARWSEANRDFLEFVERNPAYLSRDSFASLRAERSLRKLPLQSWPLFAGAPQRAEVEGVALGIDRLMKSIYERFLHNDPARLMEFYRSNLPLPEDTEEDNFIALNLNQEFAELLLQEPTGIQGALSRADYIETRDGLQCIEYNAGGFIGGLQTGIIGDLYLETPAVAHFLRERNLRARSPDTLGALFRHLVEDTARIGAWRGGEFNVAVVAHPHEPDQVALHSAEVYTRELRRTLAATGTAPGGRVFVCGAEDLVGEADSLTLEGHPVHVVIEQHDGSADLRQVFWHFKQGQVNFFSGPVSVILCDKRNLALVSEHAGSDEFTAQERGLIERHVPWTRRVLPARTTFRGRALRLPDDLPEHREELVLKKATSFGGCEVHIGRFRTDEQWKRSIGRALREEDWIVQEYLETVPYCFQSGEVGVARHDLVWGLFAFGNHFGGAFLRLQPTAGSAGVVNTRQGAEVSVLLELEE
ncbi:MAG TPA: hypothetical protein VHG28_08420 [Longimicrobiaceae bacterium]|nr:hypothetical protein [Longimicrobiaceae bacterium]